MSMENIHLWTKEALIEFQTKMKTWVKAVMPKKTSDLQNDRGFITSDDVPSSVFKATYNETPFADVKAAYEAGKCVTCDMNGYIYELTNFNEIKISFALTNKVGDAVIQENVWVNSDNTWESESVNIAKKAEVPTKTSELQNDSDFCKVVVSTEPPAEGTPNDVLTAILDGEPEEVVTKDKLTSSVDITEDFTFLGSFSGVNGFNVTYYPYKKEMLFRGQVTRNSTISNSWESLFYYKGTDIDFTNCTILGYNFGVSSSSGGSLPSCGCLFGYVSNLPDYSGNHFAVKKFGTENSYGIGLQCLVLLK